MKRESGTRSKVSTVTTYVLVWILVASLAVIAAGGAFAQTPAARPSSVAPATGDSDLGLPGASQEAGSASQAESSAMTSSENLCTDVFQLGGDRLAGLQNDDGGWDWPLDDGDPTNNSPTNTVGPIAMGLAHAYLHTGDGGHLGALGNAGTFLLAKTNNFSPSDGYLAAMLDQVFGGTEYVDHVTANFYGPLQAGTYNRNGTNYDTAGYVNLIRTARASQGIPNLAAWDIGIGLVGAASCDADTSAWVAGVKAEIDELDGYDYYDVIGLAGAVYGLAFVGEDHNPTAGQHTSATSLAGLADILASYQIELGGFTWNMSYVASGNETIQETAYAALALDAFDRATHLAAIQGAAAYMNSVQLCTGGWENYVGSTSGENNEVTGEALWGISVGLPGPATSNVLASPNPAAVNTAVGVTAFVDNAGLGRSNVSSAEYSLDAGAWQGMAAEDGAFDNVSEDVEASFTLSLEPGVYDLCVRGWDADCIAGEPECIMLVVYDPDGGFVTGGGWIDSPAGACSPAWCEGDPTGKATFGFVAKYDKKTKEPAGNTQFVFKAGDLNFHSSDYEWLMVNKNNARAQFKGTGTLNGEGAYKFMLWATDADPDTFRIKIWEEDGGETVVYDNGSEQALGGGNIVVHAKK